MEENGGGNLFELFCGMIEAFNPCMDDYLYVFDVQNDQYYISKKAMKRFALPSFQFIMSSSACKQSRSLFA